MPTHLDIEQDLHIFTEMVKNLTPYLYEEPLFGHMSNRLPKLTVGGLLLRQYRLKHLADMLSSEQKARFHEAESNLESLRYEWLTHYRNKLVQEFESRVHAIEWFVDDCSKDPSTCDANWPNEAEKRTIIAHLVKEATAQDVFSDEHKSKLAQLDQNLHRFVRRGDFLWDAALAKIYPADEFWWLHGRPGERDNS